MSPTGSSGPVRFSCPHCGTCLKVPAAAVGQEGQCPHCHKIIRATDASDAGYGLRQDAGQSHADGDALIAVVCTLCATRMYTTPDQVGQTIICPDCETANVVRAPRPAVKRRRTPAPTGKPYQVRAPEQVERPQQIVREQLSRAVERVREEIRNRPKPLRHPFLSGVYTFPFQPAVGIPCLMLAIGATTTEIVIMLIGGLPPALLVLACAAAAVGSAATMTFASVLMLTIVRATALGQDKLDQWPDPHPVDWLLQMLYILNSLMLSLLPTVLAWTVLGGQSLVPWAGLVLAPLLFPVVLLSMLEEGSVMAFFSGSIWRSLISTWWAWLIFHAHCALLAGVWFGVAFGTQSLPSHWMLAAGALAGAVCIILYSRLLGRLAYVIGSKSDEPPSDGEDSPATGQPNPAAMHL